MDSKFAFNKLAFVEMDRKNILLNRGPPSERNQCNSSFLSRFFVASKSKDSVSKCLFGRPDEGETTRLEEQMYQQQRIRAINLYQFDILTNQPVNLTPPASPYIGTVHRREKQSELVHERLRGSEDHLSENVDKNQNETVIIRKDTDSIKIAEEFLPMSVDEQSESVTTCHGITRTSLKRKSSERDQDDEEPSEKDNDLPSEMNAAKRTCR